jgi:flagellum-specific peptidoglycan hydrolase FlgJ
MSFHHCFYLFIMTFAYHTWLDYPSESKFIRAYIDENTPLAKEVEAEYGIPYQIVLAQAILESGGGKSVIGQQANNHHCIRIGDGWKGESVSGFRKYETVRDAYMDYGYYFQRTGHLCQWPYGKDWKTWAKVLEICRYAGDSPGYGEKITQIINTML